MVWRSRQLIHALPELLSAVLIVGEHVETRAHWRQQHGVAGARLVRRLPDGVRETLGFRDRTDALEDLRQMGTRLTDEDDSLRAASDRIRQSGVVAAFFTAPRQQTHGALQAFQGLDRGVHV